MLYIVREQVQSFLAEFAKALSHPNLHPVVFNIWGIGGVGKTTLLEQLELEYEEQACFIFISFGITEGVETSLQLMQKIDQELDKQLPIYSFREKDLFVKANNFQALYKQYQQIVYQLKTTTPNINYHDLPQIVQEHPATKEDREIQDLMLKPLATLTDAFLESLIHKLDIPLVLVFDNYELAATEIDIWLWQHLLIYIDSKTQKIRIVTAGKYPLIEESSSRWQPNRNLVYEQRLDEFNKEEARIYLQQIGIDNPREIQQIYKLTRGLPYYFNWIYREKEAGRKINLAQRNQATINLLLQNLNSWQKQLLQLAACCRWFNRALLRHLTTIQGINLQIFADEGIDFFEWLKQCEFVEFVQGHYRLNDVLRDELRLLLWQDDREYFYQVNAALASYFEQLGNAEVSPIQQVSAQYENPDWREYISEYLYYTLFSRSEDYRDKFLSQLFASLYFQESQIVQIPVKAIAAEAKLTEHPLLSYGSRKFLTTIKPAVEYSQLVLEAESIDWEYLEFCGYYREQIEAALQVCFGQLESLEGLPKFAGLLYKSRRCSPSEREDCLRLLFSQASKIAVPSDPEFSYDLFLGKLGKVADEFGYSEAAIASYDKALEIKPFSGIAWYKRGTALRKLGRYQEALLSYDKALELKADDPDIWCDRGTALRKLTRYSEAIASYKKALELQPDKHEAWNNCGIALRKLGRLEEAVSSYDKALEIKENDFVVWYNRGIALDDLGHFDMAVASYDKALEKQPQDCETWYNRGIALRKLGRLEEALASYDKALEFKPDDSGTWYNRGYVLDELGRFSEAIASYDKALELEPNDSSTWYNRGLALRELGRISEAIASYDKALELQPDKHQAWNNRAQALRQLGRFSEAIANYDKALELQADYPSAWYNKACSYANQGSTDLALLNLKQAINLSPVQYREMARNDPDFERIRGTEQFQNLVMGNG